MAEGRVLLASLDIAFGLDYVGEGNAGNPVVASEQLVKRLKGLSTGQGHGLLCIIFLLLMLVSEVGNGLWGGRHDWWG